MPIKLPTIFNLPKLKHKRNAKKAQKKTFKQ